MQKTCLLEKNMPSEIIIILAVLLLGSWFLIGETKTFWEKLGIVLVLAAIYVGYRLITGATLADLLTPFIKTEIY